jgi:hypothetical protein
MTKDASWIFLLKVLSAQHVRISKAPHDTDMKNIRLTWYFCRSLSVSTRKHHCGLVPQPCMNSIQTHVHTAHSSTSENNFLVFGQDTSTLKSCSQGESLKSNLNIQVMLQNVSSNVTGNIGVSWSPNLINGETWPSLMVFIPTRTYYIIWNQHIMISG